MIYQPIQRVCKYPLLFGDLFKHLPVIDCPESHAEVEKVLFRLRETAMEINKATNDEYAREKIQRSWHLQDLLIFPDPVSIVHSFVQRLVHMLIQMYLPRLQLHSPYDLWVMLFSAVFFMLHTNQSRVLPANICCVRSSAHV